MHSTDLSGLTLISLRAFVYFELNFKKMKKIGIGIVGLHFGRQILEEQIVTGPGSEYFEARALCDRNTLLLDNVSSQMGLPGHATLDSLLGDTSIQVVGLFTPPGNRAVLIKKIIDSGRHVMTTKPFERDANAALRVLKEAENRRLGVFLNSPGPKDPPDIACIKQWQEKHQLGRITNLRWETWCSYREVPDGTWYDDPALCPAAPIFRLGIYAINEFLALMRGQSEPEDVQVIQSRVFTGRPTSDQAILILKFKDGTLGSIFSSFCIDDCHRYPDSIRIGFERGSVERRDLLSGDSLARQFSLTLRTADGKEEHFVFEKPLGAHYPWQALYEHIRGNQIEIDTHPEEIAAGIAILEKLAVV